MSLSYYHDKPRFDTSLVIECLTSVVCGIGDALVQGSFIGAASGMPERYMKAVVAGTGDSGM